MRKKRIFQFTKTKPVFFDTGVFYVVNNRRVRKDFVLMTSDGFEPIYDPLQTKVFGTVYSPSTTAAYDSYATPFFIKGFSGTQRSNLSTASTHTLQATRAVLSTWQHTLTDNTDYFNPIFTSRSGVTNNRKFLLGEAGELYEVATNGTMSLVTDLGFWTATNITSTARTTAYIIDENTNHFFIYYLREHIQGDNAAGPIGFSTYTFGISKMHKTTFVRTELLTNTDTVAGYLKYLGKTVDSYNVFVKIPNGTKHGLDFGTIAGDVAYGACELQYFVLNRIQEAVIKTDARPFHDHILATYTVIPQSFTTDAADSSKYMWFYGAGSFNTTTTSSTVSVGNDGLGSVRMGYFNIPGSDALNFGSSDWTIEYWWNSDDTRPLEMMSTTSTTVLSAAITVRYQWTNSRLGLFTVNGGVTLNNGTQLVCTTTVGAFVHHAFVKSGTTIFYFRNGSLISTTSAQPTTVTDVFGSWMFGSTIYTGPYHTASLGFTATSAGNLRDLRITKGIARYLSVFTPTVNAPDGTGDVHRQSVSLHIPGTAALGLTDTTGKHVVSGSTLYRVNFDKVTVGGIFNTGTISNPSLATSQFLDPNTGRCTFVGAPTGFRVKPPCAETFAAMSLYSGAATQETMVMVDGADTYLIVINHTKYSPNFVNAAQLNCTPADHKMYVFRVDNVDSSKLHYVQHFETFTQRDYYWGVVSTKDRMTIVFVSNTGFFAMAWDQVGKVYKETPFVAVDNGVVRYGITERDQILMHGVDDGLYLYDMVNSAYATTEFLNVPELIFPQQKPEFASLKVGVFNYRAARLQRDVVVTLSGARFEETGGTEYRGRTDGVTDLTLPIIIDGTASELSADVLIESEYRKFV